MGHDVIILITDNPENVQQYGSRWKGMRFLYVKSGRLIEQLHKFLRLALLGGVDVVHCMGAGSSIFLPALINKKLFGKKFQLIVDYEDKQSLLVLPGKRRLHLLYEHLSFQCADKIVCASKELTGEYLAKNSNTYYLPFAVSQCRPVGPPESAGNQPNDPLEIGYLGSLTEAYSGQLDYLFRLMPRLKKRVGPARLNIAGSGPLREHYLNKALEMGLQDDVIFRGFVPDSQLDQFFASIDVVVCYFPDLPINRYRCPNKVFLYCSYGLPIVSNRVGEVASLLDHYANAVFYDDKDEDSCIDATRAALQLPRAVPPEFYLAHDWTARTERYLEIVKA
ncbi:glycosyltransferase family 4 protein [Geobacter sp. SVR]|uniref:glycosyltransferase family 4 protein n=1 Tax=Geobacter sp. SVR TaxID=2495594 RepID=UPI001565425B|nr:glycosyltransferase family 4 protein [Geobacter sp. SVR]